MIATYCQIELYSGKEEAVKSYKSLKLLEPTKGFELLTCALRAKLAR